MNTLRDGQWQLYVRDCSGTLEWGPIGDIHEVTINDGISVSDVYGVSSNTGAEIRYVPNTTTVIQDTETVVLNQPKFTYQIFPLNDISFEWPTDISNWRVLPVDNPWVFADKENDKELLEPSDELLAELDEFSKGGAYNAEKEEG